MHIEPCAIVHRAVTENHPQKQKYHKKGKRNRTGSKIFQYQHRFRNTLFLPKQYRKRIRRRKK